MGIINYVHQFKAKMAIVDETFPKVKGIGTVNICTVIDENGLIRGIGAIQNRTVDLKVLFESVFTVIFHPLYFLSDFDPTYPKVIAELIEGITLFKDTVHAKKNILKSTRSTLRNLTVKTREIVTKKEQKKLNTLKRKLLWKQLYPILWRMFKGFDLKNASICSYYFFSGLEELKELANKFPSLQGFYQKQQSL